MNEIIEKLLQPITPEQPCGPDWSDQPQFDELTRLIKGKPEVEVGSVVKPAEPPDWREVKARSAEFLAKSRHLGVAMMFCGASLQTAGLPGLRDGLQLLRGCVEQYWPTIFPLLDADDNNDPTQRLNILGTLNSPRGTVRPDIQQWLAIVDYLYSAPLCRPKGAEAITFDIVMNARRRAEAPAEGQSSETGTAAPAGMDLNQLNKAFRAAPVPEIEASLAAVNESLEALSGIDQFLTQNLGSGNTISFDELHKTLMEIQNALTGQLPGSQAEAGAGGEAAGAGGAAGGAGIGSATAAGTLSISGTVQSRDDVVRAIDAICDYYRQVEPSSPVPYLLRRAQKMATMNFLEAVQELNVASPDTLRPSMGSSVDSSPL